MHIPLDREQDVPLYLQIEEALRRAILTGVFVDGDKLPSTRTLAAELAVSRLTVDNAYAELAAKGFLHQRRGSGAYVAHPQAQARPARPSSDAPFPLESFTTLTSRLDGYADAPLPEGLINFAAGVGSPKVFPLEAFRKVLLSVLSRHAEEAFSYGEYCGYYPLRDTLSRILSAQGIPTQAEQVLITNGSQHAISLVVQSLLAPGDTVIVEEPTYAEALGLLRQHRINIVTVPGDRHGMRVDLLPELLERHRPKLIYTIPNFHNPTGRCLSEARRRRLLAIAQQAGVVITEDDFVGDLRYQGQTAAVTAGAGAAGRGDLRQHLLQNAAAQHAHRLSGGGQRTLSTFRQAETRRQLHQFQPDPAGAGRVRHRRPLRQTAAARRARLPPPSGGDD